MLHQRLSKSIIVTKPLTMIKINTLILLLFTCLSVFSQSSLNVNLLGHFPYTDELNDVWGYKDAQGHEYALVGVQTGFSIVDVTDPAQLYEVAFIPGPTSIWRDIKTWGHYAYVVHDHISSGTPQGLMIVDLSNLQDTITGPSVTFFQGPVTVPGGQAPLQTAHNLYIDSSGVAYLFGANIGMGGALMFDLSDPLNPSFLGMFNTDYLHDGMTRGDTLWGAAINTGRFYAIDVSDKANPQIMGSHDTPSKQSHNCWISDDNRTLYTTDEVDGGYIAAYDVSDLANITELDRIQSSPGMMIAPHNTHVKGDFLVTSYYADGLHIVDATYPDNMIEVGHFDSAPSFSGGGFNGDWGAYPWLPSENILVTDIEQGLYVVDANYTRACYLEGLVRDTVTGLSIDNADIEILSAGITEVTDLSGNYRTGLLQGGSYQVVISKAAYLSDTVTVILTNGVLTTLNVYLTPLANFSVEEQNREQIPFEIYPNPFGSELSIRYKLGTQANTDTKFSITDLSGRLVYEKKINDREGRISIREDLEKGFYLISLYSANEYLGSLKALKAN